MATIPTMTGEPNPAAGTTTPTAADAASTPQNFSTLLAAAVGLAAMGDANDEDHQLVVEHFVDDPVVADAYAAKAPQGSFQRVARMRLLAETVDGVHDALAVPASDLRQLSVRAALDPD